MRAIRVHQQGGPEVMQLDEIPVPEPGPDDVLVKIETSGLNFIDVYQRSGSYTGQLPFTLGMEGAGTIEGWGSNVTGFSKGQRVAYAMQQGTYAEYALAPAQKVVTVPDSVTTEQAAGVLLQGMTAHYLCYSTYPLRAGEVALIHAAAGGTGQLLVQVAKMRGAHVIATVGNEEKAEIAKQAGADHVIIYTQTDFEAEVRRITGGQPLDVVYDSVGKDTFEKGLNLLRPRGYMVLFGQSSGAVAPVNPQTLNSKGSLFLTRPSLGWYMLTHEELLWRANDLFNWLGSGQLKLRIDRTFPLAEVARAHDYLTGRATKGKVLLSI